MLNKKEVQHLYEYALNEIQKDLGTGITNDEQLNKYCTFLPKFRGTHAWDKIPKLKNLECCIINLDTSKGLLSTNIKTKLTCSIVSIGKYRAFGRWK